MNCDNGIILARTGRVWLISELDVDDEQDIISSKQLNNSRGRVRFHVEDPHLDGELQYNDQVYDDFRMARLSYALWDRSGPFIEPETSRSIPIEVATDGQAAIAAYLRIGGGFPNSREYVAEKMDVSKQTVSNYCQRVRTSVELEGQGVTQF